MGTVYIDWEDIEQLESRYQFQLDTVDGRRFTGSIDKSPEEKDIVLTNGQQIVEFAHADVVRIAQIEERFLDRLKGSVSMGYSYTKASGVAQGNIGFQLTHRSEIREIAVQGNTIITDDHDSETTQRSSLQLQWNRFIGNRWFASYLAGFEKNDELGLKLRSSVGAGLGRYLIRNNRSDFAVFGGLLGTREILANNVSSKENFEGLLGSAYSRYLRENPSIDMKIRLLYFPGITDAGRNRSQLDVDLRWEVFKDLFWQLTYYNTYDSKPPSTGKSTDDYGIVTSLGWSF
jgi:hypothetical protein